MFCAKNGLYKNEEACPACRTVFLVFIIVVLVPKQTIIILKLLDSKVKTQFLNLL